MSAEGGETKMLALDTHPRALASIARIRSLGALASFGFVALLTHTAGLPLFDCAMRGLIAGAVGYFVAWFVGVTVWRQLLRAELRAALIRRLTANRADS